MDGWLGGEEEAGVQKGFFGRLVHDVGTFSNPSVLLVSLPSFLHAFPRQTRYRSITTYVLDYMYNADNASATKPLQSYICSRKATQRIGLLRHPTNKPTDQPTPVHMSRLSGIATEGAGLNSLSRITSSASCFLSYLSHSPSARRGTNMPNQRGTGS